MTVSDAQRFAELLWETPRAAPSEPVLRGKATSAEPQGLPPTPKIGDAETIRLVRQAVNAIRNGDFILIQAKITNERGMDNALAVFDRALADLLERMERR